MKESKMLKLFVTSRKVKTTKGKTFIAFKTKMNLVVKGEEEKGRQVKYVDCKFVGDLMKVAEKEIRRGYISVPADKLDRPKLYVVKKNEEGKDVYPCVWIKEYSDYEEEFELPDQDEFATAEDKTNEDNAVKESDVETEDVDL